MNEATKKPRPKTQNSVDQETIICQIEACYARSGQLPAGDASSDWRLINRRVVDSHEAVLLGTFEFHVPRCHLHSRAALRGRVCRTVHAVVSTAPARERSFS